MTLILAAATGSAIHLAADNRVSTHQGRVLDEDRAGVKQIELTSFDYKGIVVYTGAARGQGYDTREWLATLLTRAGARPRRERVVDLIRSAGQPYLARIPTAARDLTILLCSLDKRCLYLDLFSNTLDFSGRGHGKPRTILHHYAIRPRRPLFITLGQRQAITRTQRRAILAALRRGESQTTMQAMLASTIREVTKGGAVPSVSPGSLVGSLMVDGSGTSGNYGSTPGIPDFIFGGANIGAWLRNHLRGVDGSVDSNFFKGEKRAPQRGLY